MVGLLIFCIELPRHDSIFLLFLSNLILFLLKIFWIPIVVLDWLSVSEHSTIWILLYLAKFIFPELDAPAPWKPVHHRHPPTAKKATLQPQHQCQLKIWILPHSFAKYPRRINRLQGAKELKRPLTIKAFQKNIGNGPIRLNSLFSMALPKLVSTFYLILFSCILFSSAHANVFFLPFKISWCEWRTEVVEVVMLRQQVQEMEREIRQNSFPYMSDHHESEDLYHQSMRNDFENVEMERARARHRSRYNSYRGHRHSYEPPRRPTSSTYRRSTSNQRQSSHQRHSY